MFVPPAAVLGATIEAIEAGCRLVVATADELPVLDTIEIRAAARANGTAFVGPNSPGIISPGKAKLGFMPSFCYKEGNVGVISRSGSLSYEGSKRLTLAGIGQSTVIGIGGDPVKGTTAAEALALFHYDPETTAVLYLGEIGGSEEIFVAEYARESRRQAGRCADRRDQTAPPGKKMGHAAALIGSKAESHEAKIAMLRDARVHIANGVGASRRSDAQRARGASAQRHDGECLSCHALASSCLACHCEEHSDEAVPLRTKARAPRDRLTMTVLQVMSKE